MATYLITGTNTGIGRTTAAALAAQGGHVILAARSREKTMPVLEDLRNRFPKAELEFVEIDLADLHSVQTAASTVLASGRPIDVLINNAGVAGAEGVTKDGFERTIGTNHVGHFALTEMLLPIIKSRIVNVSSEAHRGAKGIDFAALRNPGSRRTSFQAYSVSKLMNILHAKELARRTSINTYSLHPGVVATEIWRAISPWMQAIIKLFMISSEKGAQTTVYCATAPELASATGRYYEKSREKEPAPLAKDEALARELYTWSESAVAGVLGPNWRLVTPSKTAKA